MSAGAETEKNSDPELLLPVDQDSLEIVLRNPRLRFLSKAANFCNYARRGILGFGASNKKDFRFRSFQKLALDNMFSFVNLSDAVLEGLWCNAMSLDLAVRVLLGYENWVLATRAVWPVFVEKAENADSAFQLSPLKFWELFDAFTLVKADIDKRVEALKQSALPGQHKTIEQNREQLLFVLEWNYFFTCKRAYAVPDMLLDVPFCDTRVDTSDRRYKALSEMLFRERRDLRLQMPCPALSMLQENRLFEC